jgi:hypothetical protein
MPPSGSPGRRTSGSIFDQDVTMISAHQPVHEKAERVDERPPNSSYDNHPDPHYHPHGRRHSHPGGVTFPGSRRTFSHWNDRYRPYKRTLEQRVYQSYHPATLSRVERTALIGPLPPTVSNHDLTAYLLSRVGVIQSLTVKDDVAEVVFERANAQIAHRCRKFVSCLTCSRQCMTSSLTGGGA